MFHWYQMFKLSERGVIHLLLPIILLLGLIAAVYLVTSGNPLKLFSRATVSQPVGPEVSFTLVGPDFCNAGWACLLAGRPRPQEEFRVKLFARSDIERANLFEAKITFPQNLVEVSNIITEGSFIQNWVENFYDNATGEIALTGGIPTPGYQTQTGGESGLMAVIVFKAKALGQGRADFTSSSAIYSNLNNINILTVKRGYDISVEIPPPSPTPTPVPSPTPAAGSRVFVTSTAYNGNLGGLTGADAKCQARADAANLGGIWKAWLSDGTTSAASRLVHDTGPYKLVNGTIVASGWNDLIDGSLQNYINITELGTPYNTQVWTNTKPDGTIKYTSDNTTCANWTSNSGWYYFVHGGTTYVADSRWTDNGSEMVCSLNYRLYCFEQPSVSSSPAPTSTPTPTPSPSNKGDGNGDGVINLVDMSILHSSFPPPTGGGNPNYRVAVDMNDDGKINTLDFLAHRRLLIQLGIIRVRPSS